MKKWIAGFCFMTFAACIGLSAENVKLAKPLSTNVFKVQTQCPSNCCDKATCCKSMPSKRVLLSPKAAGNSGK